MEMRLSKSEIRKLLNSRKIDAKNVVLMPIGAKNTAFRVDNRYLLKLSSAPFDDDSNLYGTMAMPKTNDAVGLVNGWTGELIVFLMSLNRNAPCARVKEHENRNL